MRHVVREGAAARRPVRRVRPPDARSALAGRGRVRCPKICLLLRRTIDNRQEPRLDQRLPGHRRAVAGAGERLIDIHGQHAWQSLTRPTPCATCWTPTRRIAARCDGCWRAGARPMAPGRRPQVQDSRCSKERERLQWQIGELDKASPAEGEWDSLKPAHGFPTPRPDRSARSPVPGLLDARRCRRTRSCWSAVDTLQRQEHLEPRSERSGFWPWR